ncbi:hypothetical protein CONCODRAFT_16626 [Conidiobolus coronatus NRRL 28638]|uniref:U6 snRNA phosphodiesterase 1 n=1 Tax=Conidiobolus coronatus (strain ATCC 28846 / CBS 209.66 / NRRL 28638) TaxID=796925 RepID=A0A137PA57_CONC2|nr:hypothetical protein CONCODRAFT_16626 [Conidiobolus coronatus NRRL 28638]|eukprot:KXN71887.1 hypothetical protein CONCODRAFT_16626 [Conidiobolus coronatus NRRL 28638]
MEGLVNYSDSDDSDTSVNVELNNNVCINGEVNNKTESIKEEAIQSNKRKLPSISDLFESKSPKLEVDNFGKKRTIPHRRGNWATHIFLEITISTSTTQKIKNLISKLKDLNLTQINYITNVGGDKVKLKVSLSKTWYLAWSFHDKFLIELETKLKGIKKFIVNYSNWQLFSNEDFSRHFISLNIEKGHNKIEELGLKVDQ